MMEIKEKTALIVGGSTGIGKAIAETLMKRGAKIIVFGQNRPSYECEFFKVDLADENEIKKAADNISEFDILINNAGVDLKNFPLPEASSELINKTLDINLKGILFVCKYTIPKIRRSGCIVTITSIAGLKGFMGKAAYGATKAGLINMTQVLALELAEKNIRVNSIAPAIVDTPLSEKKYGENAKEHLEKTSKKYLIKRPAKPEEIAHATVFLLENEFVTGITIPVEGGVMSL